MIDTYLIIYQLGIMYTMIGGIIVSFLFALWRWYKCIKRYIETGEIYNMEGSFFFGENNWFYGARVGMYYYNNPFVVPLDFVFIAFAIAALALVWPLSIMVVSTITYAKIARIKYARKKEFIDRLSGEHV